MRRLTCKFTHLLFFISLASELLAWEARYDGPASFVDEPQAITVDNRGNCYVTGFVTGISTWLDMCTIKYDAAGNALWVQINALGPATDAGFGIAVDSGGCVYVAGTSWTLATQFDFIVAKYDSSGQQIWLTRLDSPQHGYDVANAIGLDAQGNVYVTGYYGGDSAFAGGDFGTAKLDSAGQLIWLMTYDGPGHAYDGAYCLSRDAWGNIIVAGRSVANSFDYATVKYGPNGEQLWESRYDAGDASFDQPEDLFVDDLGNVYIVGSIKGYYFNGDSTDIATIKYDSAGNEEWIAVYNGPVSLFDIGESVAVDASGNVYITGMCTVSQVQDDYVTIKYGPDGNETWVRRYSGISSDFCHNYARASPGSNRKRLCHG